MEFALKTSVAIHEHTQLLSILFDKAPESVINCDMLNNGNFRYGYWLNGGGFIVRQVSSNFNLAHIQHESRSLKQDLEIPGVRVQADKG